MQDHPHVMRQEEPYFTRTSVFDFVRIEGLQKLTSVTAHDWDLYIFKELVDNALDADEADDAVAHPRIVVEMHYGSSGQDRWLEVSVRNQAAFPLAAVKAIFDLTRRASVKDYTNQPTRGAQGNALKTILGIPYALQYRYFSNYVQNLSYKPMYIKTGDTLVDPRLDVDELNQQVTAGDPVVSAAKPPIQGTEIYVGLSRFIQTHPRGPEDLLNMARAFVLLNPHAAFDFTFTFGMEPPVQFTAEPEGTWADKYDMRRPAPVTWYRENEFRELLHALLRRRVESGQPPPTVREVAAVFGLADFRTNGPPDPGQHPDPDADPVDAETRLDRFMGQGRGMKHETVRRLRRMLRAVELEQPAPPLGAVGAGTLMAALGQRDEVAAHPQTGEPLFFYRQYRHAPPPSREEETPFVLEVALSQQAQGYRRVLVGINHTPTYRDPFFGKPLRPPDQADDPEALPRLGLDKLLDHYELREDRPLTLLVHLIAPGIVFENYGKSAITDDLFRPALTRLVDAVVEDYKAATRPPEPVDHLSEPARRLLPEAIFDLGGSPFREAQLLAALKRRIKLEGDPDMLADLQADDADSRLMSVISEHHKQHRIKGLAQHQAGRLALPHHPGDVAHVAFSGVNLLHLLHESNARAVIVAGRPEIEDLLLLMRVPTRYDAAVLRADNDLNGMLDRLVRQMMVSVQEKETQQRMPMRVPLWVVRDATPEGARLVGRVREALAGRDLPADWVIDLGLRADDRAFGHAWEDALPPDSAAGLDAIEGLGEAERAVYAAGRAARLDTLPPEYLEDWFERALAAHNLPPKDLPDIDSLAYIAAQPLGEQLRAAVAHVAFEHHGLDTVLDAVIEQWRVDQPEWKEALRARLDSMLAAEPEQAWRHKLNDAIEALVYEYLAQDQRVQAIKRRVMGGR